MKTKLIFLTTLFLIGTAFGRSKKADESVYTSPFQSYGAGPTYFIDYTNFEGTDNKTYVEFYLQVNYDELQFFKNQGQFRAGYDIECNVLDENETVLKHYTNQDVFDVNTYHETQDVKKARICLLAFSLNPGKYKIKSTVTDIETRKSSTIEQAFFVRSFREKTLSLSGIQFSQKIELAKDGQPYVKNQRYIEPNTVRTFAHGLADIFIYFEIYNLQHGFNSQFTDYTATFIIRDSQNQEVTHLSRVKPKPGTTSAHSIKFPVDYFSAGAYSLTIHVKDNDTGEVAETSKSFTVLEWPVSEMEAQIDSPFR